MNSELLQSLAFPVVLIGIFYFLLYRPQKKQQKKRQSMLEAIKVGSRIITVGGIYGRVVAINEDRVRLNIAEGVEIEVTRNAVGSNLTKEKDDESNSK